MLGITKLLCETEEIEKKIQSLQDASNPRLLQFQKNKGPVVVWNITRKCNLKCSHCYSDSLFREYSEELSTEEAMSVIDDLSSFHVPVIIFSGGEPLLRDDIFYLASCAKDKGIRCVLSTNGILIDKAMARRIKESGFSYVGISMEGSEKINDFFRGYKGAFQAALKGLRNLQDEGIYTGIRMTLCKRTITGLPTFFDLAEREKIPRLYISHLVYAGRGEWIRRFDLSHKETRWAMDFIFNKSIDFHKRGIKKDVLTGNNDADGVYLYLKILPQDKEKAEKIYKLLQLRGGNSSGVSVGCIDNKGEVHADQFWTHYSFGNVKKRPFSIIWTDLNNPVMGRLKNKKKWVKGRCRTCRFLDICGGNYRVRAERIYGHVWAEDPACYLSDMEIK